MPPTILPYISGHQLLHTAANESAVEWFEYAEREGLIPKEFEGKPIYLITQLGKIERFSTIPEAHAARARCRQGGSEHADVFLDAVDLHHYALGTFHAYRRLNPHGAKSFYQAKEEMRGCWSAETPPPPDAEIRMMAATVMAHIDALIKGGDHHVVPVKKLFRPKPADLPAAWDWASYWDRVTFLRLTMFVWQLRDGTRVEPPNRPERRVVVTSTAGTIPLRRERRNPAPAAPRRSAPVSSGPGSRIFRTDSGKSARRGASRRTDTWNLIKDGMTVAELAAAGGNLDDFKIIQRLGHVEMRP